MRRRLSARTARRCMPDPGHRHAQLARLLSDTHAFLGDHPGWIGLAVCGALILPIIAILLFTPRLGVLAIPEVLVFAGMAGWLCSEQRVSE